MAKRIVGIDIGSTSVRAVEIEGATRARPTIVRIHEVPLPSGSARSGEVIETHTVASALKRLWSTGGFKSKDVVLGMGNQRVIARDLVMPKMSLTQIREALPFQVQDMLPMAVAEALLDFYPISESEGESGPVVNGLLVAAVKQSVLANVDAAVLAGLRPVEVDLIPFALSRALLPTSSSTATVALVHVGAVTTSMIVANRGIPQFVRIIPSGGDDITAALSSRLDIDTENAEQIKRAFGLNPEAAGPEWRPAIEVIRDVSSDLLGSLRNTINFYINTRPSDPITATVLSGGGSQLPGFAAALQEITRIQVVDSDPFERFTIAKSVDRSLLDASKRSIAVALGLTLGAK